MPDPDSLGIVPWISIALVVVPLAVLRWFSRRPLKDDK